jgi:hypothetical protein
MVGITQDEKNCRECTGMEYCDGPKYLGGMCSCKCHTKGDQEYEYNHGEIRKRQ